MKLHAAWAVKNLRFPCRFCLTMLVKYYRLVIVTSTRRVRFFKKIPFNYIWGRGHRVPLSSSSESNEPFAKVLTSPPT